LDVRSGPNQPEHLAQPLKSKWQDFIAISNQFADHVGLALRAAKERSDDTFKSLVEQGDRQAGHTEEIVRCVKNLANEKRHEVDALRAGNEETQRQLAEFKVQLDRLTRERREDRKGLEQRCNRTRATRPISRVDDILKVREREIEF
jgi:hypothetical protein